MKTWREWFLEWLPSIGSVVIMFGVVLLLGALIVGIPKLFGPLPTGEIQMGLVVVFAIGALLILLNVTAYVFDRLHLANPQQPLGLPEGSVRALIALFLIMIFIIMSVYLFRTIAGTSGVLLENLTTGQVAALGGQVTNIVQNKDGTFNVVISVGVTAAGEQLGLQLATILGTLVTAVSAFYFGSSTATAAQRADLLTTDDPSANNITPDPNPPPTLISKGLTVPGKPPPA